MEKTHTSSTNKAQTPSCACARGRSLRVETTALVFLVFPLEREWRVPENTENPGTLTAEESSGEPEVKIPALTCHRPV